jgi:hypothetical protein
MGFSMFFIGLHPWFIPRYLSAHLLEQGIRSGRPEGGAPVPFLLVNPPCFGFFGLSLLNHHVFIFRV